VASRVFVAVTILPHWLADIGQIFPVRHLADVHRRQLTFEYLDTVSRELKAGRVVPADREHLREWLRRFAGHDDVRFALEEPHRALKQAAPLRPKPDGVTGLDRFRVQ
jgi:hypothetical protein